MDTTMIWLIAMEYLCQKWPRICSTSRFFPHSWLITGFITRLTRRVALVEQELLPEHLRSIPFLVGVRVTRSLVLYVCIVDRCLSFCSFSFGHFVGCPSIYGFWLPLLYLQNVLKEVMIYSSTNINNTNIWRRGCRLWFETCKQIWRNQTG
jgi:hypothetical protein